MDAELLKSVGLPDEIVATLTSDEMLPKLTAFVEKVKEPVAAKNQELLSKHTALNGFVQSLGGQDAIKSLADSAAQAKAEAAAAAQAAAAKSGDVEAIKKDYEAKFESVVKERDTFRDQLVQRDVSKTISEAISKAKGAPALLEPLVKGRVKSELVEGQVKITVLTENGAPMLNEDGKDASVDDLVSEFRKNAAYARAFDGNKASGSGASVSGAAESLNGTDNPWNPATFNFTKQNELYAQNPAVARRLAAMYGKTLA